MFPTERANLTYDVIIQFPEKVGNCRRSTLELITKLDFYIFEENTSACHSKCVKNNVRVLCVVTGALQVLWVIPRRPGQ